MPALVIFELDAVVEVAGFDAVVAFGPALDGHLALLRASFERGDFIIQAQETFISLGIEPAFLDRKADRASRIALVAAVAELASFGERLDVGETLAQDMLVGPHLDLAHARVVDEHAAAREDDQFAGGGGMSAFAGDLVDFTGPLPIVAAELVDQRGFSDATGADHAHRDSRAKVREERLKAFAVERVGDMDDGPGAQGGDFGGGLLV